MPVARYVTYKCKNCGYKMTRFESNVILIPKCPKCGEEMEIEDTSIDPPVNSFIKKLIDTFLKKH